MVKHLTINVGIAAFAVMLGGALAGATEAAVCAAIIAMCCLCASF